MPYTPTIPHYDYPTPGSVSSHEWYEYNQTIFDFDYYESASSLQHHFFEDSEGYHEHFGENDYYRDNESVKSDVPRPTQNEEKQIGFSTSGRSDHGNKKPELQIEKLFNQNVRGWNNSITIESTIQMMMEKDIGVATLQETWQRGEWEKVIRGYLVVHRNYETRPECLSKSRSECRGVAIILSPRFKLAYERDGRPHQQLFRTTTRDTAADSSATL